MIKKIIGLIMLSVLIAPNNLFAQMPKEEAERKGIEIVKEAIRRDDGFGDFQSGLKMILTNRQGRTSTRVMRAKTLEVLSDGDKSLTVFDNPRDVKGSAFLSFTHIQGTDDQWLYLPALKRVKRISSDNKSGSFMGSEFSFEDLASEEVEKYTYLYLRDEVLEGQNTFVIERYPVDPKSGYSRQNIWYDQDEYRIQKIVIYDRKDKLLKTLVYSGYNQYLEKYWHPDEAFVKNHQTGKTTKLVWENYQFKSGLTEDDFDQDSLKRTR
jgi:hypothetical protein